MTLDPKRAIFSITNIDLLTQSFVVSFRQKQGDHFRMMRVRILGFDPRLPWFLAKPVTQIQRVPYLYLLLLWNLSIIPALLYCGAHSAMMTPPNRSSLWKTPLPQALRIIQGIFWQKDSAIVATQHKEKRLLHAFQIHDAEHGVGIYLAEHIIDGQVVVGHGGGGFSPVVNHPQAGGGLAPGQQWQHPLEQLADPF